MQAHSLTLWDRSTTNHNESYEQIRYSLSAQIINHKRCSVRSFNLFICIQVITQVFFNLNSDWIHQVFLIFLRVD